MNGEAAWAARARERVNEAGWLLVRGLEGEVPLAEAIEGARDLLDEALEAERERAAAARAAALLALEPPPRDDARQSLPSVLAALRRVLRR